MTVPGPIERTDLDQGNVLPENWLDNLMELLAEYASPNFRITLLNPTAIQVVAGSDNDRVALAITGRWRWIDATVTAAHPGGAAGTYNIWATSGPNSWSVNPTPPPDEADLTDRRFFLKILPTSSTPSGTGSETIYRKVGTLLWDGSKIIRILPFNCCDDAALSYSATIGNGSATVFTVTHNLDSKDVLVEVRLAASPEYVVYPLVRKLSTSEVTISFAAPPASNAYRVVVTRVT